MIIAGAITCNDKPIMKEWLVLPVLLPRSESQREVFFDIYDSISTIITPKAKVREKIRKKSDLVILLNISGVSEKSNIITSLVDISNIVAAAVADFTSTAY